MSLYQVSFPFVNSYLDQDFSGILQNKADVSVRYFERQGYFVVEYESSAKLLSILFIVSQISVIEMTSVSGGT
jgi:hypothetical protein